MGKLTNLNPTASGETFTPSAKATIISEGAITATGNFAGYSGLEIKANTAIPNSAAFLMMIRPAVNYGIHFGLDSTNQLGIGGGNMGSNFYRLFHEGNPITVRAVLPPATIGANSSAVGHSSTGTTDFCNYPGTNTGDAYHFYRLPGNTAGVPGPGNRISRIDATGTYFQISDRRVKTSFAPAPGLDVIRQLEPLTYKHWEVLGHDINEKFKLGKFWNKIGFIAQDVGRILPQAVTAPDSESDFHSLDYNCLLTCAIQAIKELEQRIVELEQPISKA